MYSKAFKAERHSSWNDAPRRLIVFGDSWSDNGLYPVDPPSQGQDLIRDEARGKAWTDWVCLLVDKVSNCFEKSTDAYAV